MSGLRLVSLWLAVLCVSAWAQLGILPYSGAGGSVAAIAWTERTIAGTHRWNSIAASSDATKLVLVDNGAVDTGDLWTSTNSGTSWTDQSAAGARSWQIAAISSDGSVIAASHTEAMSRGVVVSVDAGGTWDDRAVAGSVALVWLTMSGDGTKIAVTDPSGGALYLSTNSGATWTASAGAGTHAWTGIKYSRDGSTIVAITTNLVLLTTNGGSSWTDITPTTGDWDGLGVSSDGTRIAISKDAGVWYSTNSGASFTELAATTAFGVYGIALSDAGTTLLVVTDAAGNMQRSTDSGGSWTAQSPPGIASWITPAISANGLKSVAVVLDGNVWTGQ